MGTALNPSPNLRCARWAWGPPGWMILNNFHELVFRLGYIICSTWWPSSTTYVVLAAWCSTRTGIYVVCGRSFIFRTNRLIFKGGTNFGRGRLTPLRARSPPFNGQLRNYGHRLENHWLLPLSACDTPPLRPQHIILAHTYAYISLLMTTVRYVGSQRFGQVS